MQGVTRTARATTFPFLYGHDDSPQWYDEDSGYVRYRDHQPVTEPVIMSSQNSIYFQKRDYPPIGARFSAPLILFESPLDFSHDQEVTYLFFEDWITSSTIAYTLPILAEVIYFDDLVLLTLPKGSGYFSLDYRVVLQLLYRNNSYALPEEKGEFQPEPFVPQSVRIVLRAIEAGETDFTVIANKAGFRDRSELATYMKAQGWNWSSTERTYIKEGISDEEGPAEIEPTEEVTDQENGLSISADIDIRRFLPLLEYLEENLDRLETILQTYDSKNIPHYNFRGGITITKSVSMSSTLDQLIRDFSAEMGVSQRVIFEAALIQFMEKYGYAEQVKSCLG